MCLSVDLGTPPHFLNFMRVFGDLAKLYVPLPLTPPPPTKGRR